MGTIARGYVGGKLFITGNVVNVRYAIETELQENGGTCGTYHIAGLLYGDYVWRGKEWVCVDRK